MVVEVDVVVGEKVEGAFELSSWIAGSGASVVLVLDEMIVISLVVDVASSCPCFSISAVALYCRGMNLFPCECASLSFELSKEGAAAEILGNSALMLGMISRDGFTITESSVATGWMVVTSFWRLSSSTNDGTVVTIKLTKVVFCFSVVTTIFLVNASSWLSDDDTTALTDGLVLSSTDSWIAFSVVSVTSYADGGLFSCSFSGSFSNPPDPRMSNWIVDGGKSNKIPWFFFLTGV